MFPASSFNGRGVELSENTACHRSRQFDWNRIAQLAHGLRPRTVKAEVIWKSLEARALAHGQIPNVPVWQSNHVLPAGNAVNACLQGFRGKIKRASGVSRV